MWFENELDEGADNNLDYLELVHVFILFPAVKAK